MLTSPIRPLHIELTLIHIVFNYNSCRDETLEALSDAQFVAPAAKTVDLHSANHRNSFLYVFDYQTKYGDFPQVIFRGRHFTYLHLNQSKRFQFIFHRFFKSHFFTFHHHF